MKFSKWIKKLKKNKRLSMWPPTWMPFVFTILLLGEAYVFPIARFKMPLYYASGFAFLYAIAHWNVVRILKGKS